MKLGNKTKNINLMSKVDNYGLIILTFFKIYFNTNVGKVNNPSLGSTFSTNLPSFPYFLNDLIFPWIKREVRWY